MHRLLVFLLTLAFGTAAAAAPTVLCASDGMGAGARQHACCQRQAALVAPAGACCLASVPVERAVIELSVSTPRQHEIASPATSHVSWLPAAPVAAIRRSEARSAPIPRGIPIYLEQLSLLI